MVDNIIQTPLTNKRLKVTVSEAVGVNTETITVSAGIGSLTKGDVLKLNDEFARKDIEAKDESKKGKKEKKTKLQQKTNTETSEEKEVIRNNDTVAKIKKFYVQNIDLDI